MRKLMKFIYPTKLHVIVDVIAASVSMIILLAFLRKKK